MPVSSAGARTIVLHNATVRTLDATDTIAEAVAVRDGRILLVGGGTHVLAAFPDAERRDLGGATLLPGLIDSHLHLLALGLNSFAVDLSGARSIEDVLAALRRRVERTPADEWVLSSSRWHESQLAEGRFPTRAELDGVSRSLPILLRRGGHNVVANSAALTGTHRTRPAERTCVMPRATSPGT
jgi:predicted amidohydrolase YtcJ